MTDGILLVVLPLQKLIHLHSSSDSDSDPSDSDNDERATKRGSKWKRSFWSRLRRSKAEHDEDEPPKPIDTPADVHNPTNGFISAHIAPSTKSPVTPLRTLQRYHGGPNEERIQFMENHSALASKNLGVSVEQVSSMSGFIDLHSRISEAERHIPSARRTCLCCTKSSLRAVFALFHILQTMMHCRRPGTDRLCSIPHSRQYCDFILREFGRRHRNADPFEAEHSGDYPQTLSGCVHDRAGDALLHRSIEAG